MRRRVVMSVLSGVLLLALMPGRAPAGGALRHLGAHLPPGAEEVGPHRYQSPWGWDDTLRWIDRTYGWRYRRIPIVDRPGLRAIHLRNRRDGAWMGINVYESEGRGVRLYVVPAPRPAEEGAAATRPDSSRLYARAAGTRTESPPDGKGALTRLRGPSI